AGVFVWRVCDGPRLNHRAPRRGQPPEAGPERLPAGRARPGLGGTDVGGRLEGPADRVRVRGRVDGGPAVDVEVQAGAQVVALPAVDEDAGVEGLPPFDPRDHAQHRV